MNSVGVLFPDVLFCYDVLCSANQQYCTAVPQCECAGYFRDDWQYSTVNW